MDTSGSNRSRTPGGIAAIVLLGAAVVALSAAAMRAFAENRELRGEVKALRESVGAAARDEALERRVAVLERERVLEENRALQTTVRNPAPPPSERPPAIRAERPVGEAREPLAKARAELDSFRYAEAFDLLERAARFEGLSAAEWWDLSVAGLAAARYGDSGEAFTRALRLGYRDLFGPHRAPSLRYRSREEYAGFLRGLTLYATSHPEDLHARTLLAYHRYFEEGPNCATADLVEITRADPGFEPARRLLDCIERQ